MTNQSPLNNPNRSEWLIPSFLDDLIVVTEVFASGLSVMGYSTINNDNAALLFIRNEWTDKDSALAFIQLLARLGWWGNVDKNMINFIATLRHERYIPRHKFMQKALGARNGL